MLNFCILNSDYLLRTFELKFWLFQKVRLIIFKTVKIIIYLIIIIFYYYLIIVKTVQT